MAYKKLLVCAVLWVTSSVAFSNTYLSCSNEEEIIKVTIQESSLAKFLVFESEKIKLSGFATELVYKDGSSAYKLVHGGVRFTLKKTVDVFELYSSVSSRSNYECSSGQG